MQTLPRSEGPTYSNGELWTKAEEAATVWQAYGYLNRLDRERATLDAIAGRIESLSGSSPLPIGRWAYFEALLQSYGSRAESFEDLRLLARLAESEGQALTQRDVAFRSFIENFSRLDAGDLGDNPLRRQEARAYALIDALYEEANSLSGTALQAEHFLLQKSVSRGDGSLLLERAQATLFDPAALESNRLAAAEVLIRRGAWPDSAAIRGAFETTESEGIQVALLQMLAAADAPTEDIVWLESLQPATPEQERLVWGILSRETQAGVPVRGEP